MRFLLPIQCNFCYRFSGSVKFYGYFLKQVFFQSKLEKFTLLMEKSKSLVEIGYLEKSDNFKLESRFFPSKVGGKPAWLDLKNICVDVCCKVCREPCVFLCQIYAPGEQEDSYHRTIYIFVCKNPECCHVNDSRNFIVLRCQLNRRNCFYVEEDPSDTPDWHPESCVSRFTSVCEVCGCFGSYQCSKCKIAKYCTKTHQILHWKSGHNKNCNSSNYLEESNPFLLPEYEIITEQEFEEVESENIEVAIKSEKSYEEKMKEYEDLVIKGKVGAMDDANLAQLELLAFKKEDKYFKKFKQRLNLCPDQVLRYEKGGEPLWITKPFEVNVPVCDYCGGPRVFEFQVLSTLLGYLNVDTLGKSIDWGTLLIYTCKSSCNKGPSYKDEFLYKQDIQ